MLVGYRPMEGVDSFNNPEKDRQRLDKRGSFAKGALVANLTAN
jgi:hypothetical protein